MSTHAIARTRARGGTSYRDAQVRHLHPMSCLVLAADQGTRRERSDQSLAGETPAPAGVNG
jgi:hypothetical protein